MDLRWTQPLTQMSSRDISWGGGGGEERRLVFSADNLATVLCQLPRNPGSLKLLEPEGPLQACIEIG